MDRSMLSFFKFFSSKIVTYKIIPSLSVLLALVPISISLYEITGISTYYVLCGATSGHTSQCITIRNYLFIHDINDRRLRNIVALSGCKDECVITKTFESSTNYELNYDDGIINIDGFGVVYSRHEDKFDDTAKRYRNLS